MKRRLKCVAPARYVSKHSLGFLAIVKGKEIQSSSVF